MKNIKLFAVFLLVFLFSFGLVTSSVSFVTAQTTATVDSTASTEDLLQLIAKLQAQIKALSQGQSFSPIVSPVGSMKDRIEFKQELKRNSENVDVKTLQRFLATDKTIYPEGLDTGFFGSLTSEALKRFQTRFKLEVSGELDAATKELINKILQTRGIGKEIPPGLLIAPGLRDGKFEFKMEIREDDSDGRVESRLEIEVEEKHNDVSKVKVDYRDNSVRAKRVFLLNTVDREEIIKELVKRLGLSEQVIKSAIKFDSDDEDEDEDEDEDDEGDSDDDEDDSDENEDGDDSADNN